MGPMELTHRNTSGAHGDAMHKSPMPVDFRVACCSPAPGKARLAINVRALAVRQYESLYSVRVVKRIPYRAFHTGAFVPCAASCRWPRSAGQCALGMSLTRGDPSELHADDASAGTRTAPQPLRAPLLSSPIELRRQRSVQWLDGAALKVEPTRTLHARDTRPACPSVLPRLAPLSHPYPSLRWRPLGLDVTRCLCLPAPVGLLVLLACPFLFSYL